MGKPEKLILETMRSMGSRPGVWDTSKIKDVVFPPATRGRRQVYRIIDRLNVTPPALSLPQLLDSVPSDQQRAVEKAVGHAQAQRMQTSIVQLKEVRMGTWALLWNNLRLAKHWIWLADVEDLEEGLRGAVDQMIRAHRLPCCLIFHPSAQGALKYLNLPRQVEQSAPVKNMMVIESRGHLLQRIDGKVG
ncbi:hypothetical protein N9Y18_06305 [Litoricolaceae bacterium]|nr:hypothetical protein [Litorivicinaceae bacterium]